jgi:hypothetical protein
MNVCLGASTVCIVQVRLRLVGALSRLPAAPSAVARSAHQLALLTRSRSLVVPIPPPAHEPQSLLGHRRNNAEPGLEVGIVVLVVGLVRVVLWPRLRRSGLVLLPLDAVDAEPDRLSGVVVEAVWGELASWARRSDGSSWYREVKPAAPPLASRLYSPALSVFCSPASSSGGPSSPGYQKKRFSFSSLRVSYRRGETTH